MPPKFATRNRLDRSCSRYTQPKLASIVQSAIIRRQRIDFQEGIVTMKRNEIKATLVLKDITMTAIANEAESSLAEVSRCIRGTGYYLRVRKAIAARLGMPIDEVFAADHYKPRKR